MRYPDERKSKNRPDERTKRESSSPARFLPEFSACFKASALEAVRVYSFSGKIGHCSNKILLEKLELFSLNLSVVFTEEGDLGRLQRCNSQ